MACKKSFKRRPKMSAGQRRNAYGKPRSSPQRQLRRRRAGTGPPTGRERRFSNVSRQASALLTVGISETLPPRQEEYFVCSQCGTQLATRTSRCRGINCYRTEVETRERTVTETVTIRTSKPTEAQMAKAIAVILAHRAAKRDKNRQKKQARRARQ